MSRRPSVIIVGGGLGGLCAAQALKSAPVDVTLIDRNNHHLFQPLLYQVATGSLSDRGRAHPKLHGGHIFCSSRCQRDASHRSR